LADALRAERIGIVRMVSEIEVSITKHLFRLISDPHIVLQTYTMSIAKSKKFVKRMYSFLWKAL
jgi:hypothetical protein